MKILILMLIASGLVLTTFRIVVSIMILSIDRKIYNLLDPEHSVSSLLLLDYKTALFKNIDTHLSSTENPLLKVIFISTSWLYKVKKKSWNCENLYAISSDQLHTKGFSRLLSSKINGEIKSVRGILDYIRMNGDRYYGD
jgi:hypothetical protein